MARSDRLNPSLLNGKLALWLFLLASVFHPVMAEEIPPAGTYPWRAETTTKLHLRVGPGQHYASLGVFDPGALVIVDAPVPNSEWVKVSFLEHERGPMEGYVHAGYLHFINQINPPAPEKKSGPLRDVFAAIWKVLKWILIGLLVVLVLTFKEELLELAAPALTFGGAGALLFWILFHNGSLGFVLGLVAGVLFGLRDFVDYGQAGGVIRWLMRAAYWLISLPFYILNWLQIFLAEPWRMFFKRNRLSEDSKNVVRPLLEGLKVILYIAATPLRLLNAIYFNILIHGVSEIYDFLLEVLAPSKKSEGRGDLGRWLLMLPWRILRYLVWDVLLTLLEGVIWTVIDVFLPAATLYHGTDLTAGQSIAGRREFDSGTFRASVDSWAGVGVYFAPRRTIADDYAQYRKLDDDNPVTIVCRVTPGRVINLALAPSYVYHATGGSGRHSLINRFAEENHYTTCEWWNGAYWEYCLFDWQNLYNQPWRIRPIYLYNHRTKMLQHIRGGMVHWLFKKL